MTLAARLSAGEIFYMRACIGHARRGSIRHDFRHDADYLLLAPRAMRVPGLLSRNRFNLFSWHDTDHGGPRGAGTGALWAGEKLAAAGLGPRSDLVLALLTQPRFLGHWFNPVSFWMAIAGDELLAVIAEVNNTFGQRHSYLLARPDFQPITADVTLSARKIFHVSPFQDVAGEYRFSFNLRPESVAIRIRQIDGTNGLETFMTGLFQPLMSRHLMRAALRRPGGSLRVLALIYWHALRLKMKGAAYHKLPAPPEDEISR